MEQISILFFALASFFGIEDDRIFAYKTTVTVYPDAQEIVILQEDLFTIIQSKSDSTLVLEQWDKLSNWNAEETTWSDDLDEFPSKDYKLNEVDGATQAELRLTYSHPRDLGVFALWYSKTDSLYSINKDSQDNVKTEDGFSEGIYWRFSGDSSFSFTVEPFTEMPERYQKLAHPIDELIKN